MLRIGTENGHGDSIVSFPGLAVGNDEPLLALAGIIGKAPGIRAVTENLNFVPCRLFPAVDNHQPFLVAHDKPAHAFAVGTESGNPDTVISGAFLAVRDHVPLFSPTDGV